MLMILIVLSAYAGCLVGARMAYGCWPWEWQKTWHNTKLRRTQ